eukprot:COSAG06_NODE_1980_length_7926_cov_10.286061_8_plen_160_part_00
MHICPYLPSFIVARSVNCQATEARHSGLLSWAMAGGGTALVMGGGVPGLCGVGGGGQGARGYRKRPPLGAPPNARQGPRKELKLVSQPAHYWVNGRVSRSLHSARGQRDIIGPRVRVAVVRRRYPQVLKRAPVLGRVSGELLLRLAHRRPVLRAAESRR